MKLRLLFACLLLATLPVLAQEQEKTSDEQPFTIDTPVSLDFEKEEEEIETPKKKKPKKKVFYGIKTKKGFTRKGYGNRVTYELFII